MSQGNGDIYTATLVEWMVSRVVTRRIEDRVHHAIDDALQRAFAASRSALAPSAPKKVVANEPEFEWSKRVVNRRYTLAPNWPAPLVALLAAAVVATGAWLAMA